MKTLRKQSNLIIILGIIILLTIFKTQILTSLSSLPFFTIDILSIILAIIILIIFSRQQSEADELKNEFVKVVTHKFRTPLTEIRWATESLKDNNITNLDKGLALDQIDQARQKLNEIVDLLVGLVKFDDKMEYAFEAVSLRELFDESLQKYAGQIKEKNIAFSIQQSPDIPLIIIDGKKIQFILDTLLDNAISYSKSGGKITTTISQDTQKIFFKITDTGIGIEANDLNKIFEKFYRTTDSRLADTEGLGISLHIAREIARKHDGALYAESAGQNQGATFTLEIPKK
ncbi:MAG: HAMP domain-containing sensor histidine kinase [bacterium]